MSFRPGWHPPEPTDDDGYWVSRQSPHTSTVPWSAAALASWAHAQTTGTRVAVASDGVIVTPDNLCPDLLRWSNIGAADGLRGRVVRGFFYLMRLWPPRGTR